MRTVLKLICKYLFKLRIANLALLSFQGPTIILPNHVSFLDAVILYLFLPEDVYFVVNTAIAQRFAVFLKGRNCIAIDPLNPYSLKRIIEVVRNNHPVVLFPEGRITTTGGLMKVYNGVGFIALKTHATLYPLIFLGPERSKLSRIKDKVRSRWFPAVQLFVDRPVQLAVHREKSFKAQKLEIRDKILRALQNALFHAKQHFREADNLFDLLLMTGEKYGMRSVIAEDISGRSSYKRLLTGSYVLAEKLRLPLESEGRVGILLPNSLGHLATLFALFYLGKTPAIFNFSAGLQNNLDYVETAALKTVITSRLFVTKAGFQDLVDRLEQKCRVLYLEDIRDSVTVTEKFRGILQYWRRARARYQQPPQLILFTSGSESRPKGVMLSHASIMANINQISCVIDYTPKDRLLNALPMFHSFGLTAGTLLPLMSGVPVFLYPSPLHYKIIPELAYDRNATILLGTPTFLAGYAKYAGDYDFYSMRYVIAGGEKLKDEVRSAWQEKFGLRILEGYGTTETGPVLSLNTPLFYRKGSVGKFLPDIEWKLAEVEGINEGGNLLVKGPNVMDGYFLYQQGFVPRNEWYDCGDIVTVDAEQFITIRSRVKRFAKISGEMVSLDMVEQLARQCFGTEKNAAISVPDDRKGEKIILYTTKKEAQKQQLREYIGQARQNMLVMPAEVIVLEKLPLLGSGKTDYVTLKADALKERETDVS
ncbi:MAG TPA: AMP-binding protein [Negativicutes bacterium]|nr:AMP-binding protein [Negativicutes bacterium]